MKIAVVHDWLVTEGGAEKVLRHIVDEFPGCDLYSMVCFLGDAREGPRFMGKPVTTSFIQRLPFAKKKYRQYLPLMPVAVEQFDLSGYDLVISSSHAVAKGVITGPGQVHVAYVHSPARYAWDLQAQYLRESNLTRGVKSAIARWLLHKFRMWDMRTAAGVDCWIANSHFIARRIRKVYRTDPIVLHPPVNVGDFRPGDSREEFYLTVSRMVPYKRIPLIAQAFTQMPDKRLVIIGDGPEMDVVRKVAGPNVAILGRQPHASLLDHMQRAKAFVFAAEEDFGIVPLEAQACATPVLAFGRGGALETVLEGKTGLFFHEQKTESIVDVVRRFEMAGVSATPEEYEAHVDAFSPVYFRSRLRAIVENALAAQG